MSYIVVPNGREVIPVRNARALLRAFACCNVLGIPPPTEAQVKWVESQAEEYDGANFWVPYGQHQGANFMKPWAVALLRYLPSKPVEFDHLARIDPYSFYHDFTTEIIRIDAFGHLLDAASEAWWLATPEGARAADDESWAEKLDLLYTEVRIAGTNGTLLTNPRAIKRLRV